MMRSTFEPFSASEELNDLSARKTLLNVDEIAAEVVTVLTPRCVDCGRKLRQARVPAAKAPGTVPAASGGLCRTCWRHKTGETKPPRPHTVHLQVARDEPDDAVAAVRALVARRGCPEVLDILGIAP